MRCLFSVIILLVISVFLNAEDRSQTADLIEMTCFSCHDKYFFNQMDYDFKEWELNVENMRTYTSISDEEAYEIANYLASPQFEKDFFPKEVEGETTEEVSEVETKVEKVKELVEESKAEIKVVAPVTVATDIKSLRRANNIKRFWIPSKNVLRTSRLLGYISIIMLVALAITGLMRRKLKRNFRIVHRVTAYILIGAVLIHTTIYLFKFGAPAVLWLWFGIIASLTLTISEGSGEIRRKVSFIKENFKLIHYSAGILCIIGSVLHWVWAWI